MAIVLYASAVEQEGSVPLFVRGWRSGENRLVYVRAELMEDEWPGPAMSKARPNAGEVALNAIPNKVTVEFKVKPTPQAELVREEPTGP